MEIALKKPFQRLASPLMPVFRWMGRVLTPFEIVSSFSARVLFFGWVGYILLYWTQYSSPIFPRPLEVLSALKSLWMEQDLFREIMTSFRVNVEALLIASIVSLGLAILSVVPAVAPLVAIIRRLRFVGFTGLTIVFLFVFGGGHQLKLGILSVGIGLFLTDVGTDIVSQVSQQQLDYSRTLRNNEWQVLWKVVVRGRLDVMIDAIRSNAAMSWIMITAVEGLVRSEGGLGGMVLSQNRTFRLPDIFAIATVFMMVGLGQDIGIGRLKMLICPHVAFRAGRR